MELLTSNLPATAGIPVWLLILIMLWVLPWKGYALWTASRHSHKKWFIVLLVVNTLAILDIVYIFFISKRKKK